MHATAKLRRRSPWRDNSPLAEKDPGAPFGAALDVFWVQRFRTAP